MTKYFCDGCEKEVTKDNDAHGGFNTTGRLGTTLQRGGHEIKIEVLTSMDGTANNGLFCRHCVLDALLKLDDRPRAA